MVFISLLIALFCFLIAALAPVFEWTLGSFNAIAWGLFFFTLASLVPGAVSVYRTRNIN